MKTPFLTHRNRFPKQNAPLFQLLTVAIISASLCPSANAFEMKGMCYVAWDANGLLTEYSDASLANARAVGCEWIALNVYWFQDDVNSTIIEPDYSLYSPTPDSIVHAIDKCHGLGMKVMLKPFIHCRDYTWQGFINPSPAWFAAYQDFINTWAMIAQDNGVELFCIGSELTNTTGQSSSWTNLIQNIRQYYTGPLTYGANPDEEKSIDWWNEVNYIGIDAYYPLTDHNDPTQEELNSAWTSLADTIETWRNSNWPDMQIIFTETGCRSIDGTNTGPWNEPPVIQIDLQEQADCYVALLSQCQQRDWWAGVFWWKWEASPDFGGMEDSSFSPQNKPAEAVIANYYIRLRGDFDSDYSVDFYDLSKIPAFWLSYHPSIDIYPPPAGDGIIDFRDFASLAENWMQAATP